MLLGSHDLTLNGVKKTIKINRVEVAAEGGAAFWSNPQTVLVRIIDAGSATINCASLVDGKYIDKDSFTINFGCNTTKSNDLYAMVRGIVAQTSKKWSPSDTVLVMGGVIKRASIARSHRSIL